MSTDIKKTMPSTELAVLDHDPRALRELLAPLGGTISLSDLDRIKMPSGGALTFAVPTASGEEPRRTLTGVIVGVQLRRAFWSAPYAGAGVAPDCASADGVTGVGDPGGECVLCPHSQFPDGGAPGCRQTAEIMLFASGDLLPTIVTASPASVRPVARYAAALVKRGYRLCDVVTIFGLERATSRGGIVFAKLTLTMVGVLEPAQRQRLREIVAALGFTPAAAPAPASEAPVPPVEREPGCDDVEIPEHATLDVTTDDDSPPPVVEDDVGF
jgi:hypothetical protein